MAEGRRRTRANVAKKEPFLKTSAGRALLAAVLLVGVAALAYGAWRAFVAVPGAEVLLLDDEHGAGAGNSTMFGVRVENTGGARDTFFVRTAPDAPAGFTATSDRVALAKGASELVLVTIGVPATAAAGRAVVPLEVASAHGLAKRLDVAVQVISLANASRVRACSDVEVHYVGSLVEGAIFDASLASVGASNFPKDEGFTPRPASQAAPLKVHVPGTGCTARSGYIDVVKGFSAGLVGMRVGETRLVRIAAKDAYGEEPNPSFRLAGRDLVFQMTVVSLQ